MATWELMDPQDEAFVQTFNLYRPAGEGDGDGWVELTGVVLAAAGVPGRIQSKVEAADLIPFGRGNVDQMDTTDIIHLPEVLDDDSEYLNIGDGWFAKLISGGGSENGSWFAFSGEGINLVTFVSERQYLVRRNTLPTAVAP